MILNLFIKTLPCFYVYRNQARDVRWDPCRNQRLRKSFDETQYCLIRSFSWARPHCLLWRNCGVQYDDGTHQTLPTLDINFTWWLFYNFLPTSPPAVNRVMLLLLIHQYDWVLAPLTLSVPRLSNTCFPTDYHQGSLDLSPANGDVCSWWRLEYSVTLLVALLPGQVRWGSKLSIKNNYQVITEERRGQSARLGANIN